MTCWRAARRTFWRVSKASKPLAGVGVLVTRPAGRADALSALIEEHGGEAIGFPVIDIQPPADAGALLAALNNLEEVALIIFVSVHAVESVGKLLAQHRIPIPTTTRVAAAGPQTAAHCERAAIAVDFVPRKRIDSEGLLEEMRAFDAAGKTILIFRAQSGRELLKQKLEARGATVRYIESYQRQTATPPIEPLLTRWRANQIHAVVISSAEIMDALKHQLTPPNHPLLNTTPIITYGERVATHCQKTIPRSQVYASLQPTDEAVMKAILEWRAGR